MYGIICSRDFENQIKDALKGKQILFEKTGTFAPEEFQQLCAAAAGVSIEVLIVDLTCCDSDEDIVKGIRKYRFSRSSRVIIIAPGRKPGDKTISALVNIGVYDIIAPDFTFNDDEEPDLPDIRFLLTQQLEMPYHFGNAARWHVLDEIEPSPGKKKEKIRVEKEVVRLETYKVLPNKTIVIGSLYPGAGSTFVTLTIARLLNHLGIPCAVVESPINAPELYGILHGDRYAPHDRDAPYIFLSDQIFRSGRAGGTGKEWKNGHTTFYPVNPRNSTIKTAWSYEHTFKLLLSVKSPIVLYDVSHHWQHESVQNICMDADEVVFVCDPNPAKFYREDTVQNVEWMIGLKENKPVHLVGNRDVSSRRAERSEWIRSLPIKPVCLHPFISFKDVIESVWKGELIQDREDIRQQLLLSCYPVVRALIPPSFPLKPIQQGNKLFSRLKGVKLWR